MKQIITIVLFLSVFALSSGQTVTIKRFSDFEKMREYLGELFQQEKYLEAVGLLEYHMDIFPDQRLLNSFNLAIVCARLKKFNKGIEALQQAHEHNLWFNKYAFEGSVWNGYKALDEFDAVYQRNEEMRAEEQKMAKSIESC